MPRDHCDQPEDQVHQCKRLSNYIARADYQDEVVSLYIESLNGEFEGLYNESGRAFPNIAA